MARKPRLHYPGAIYHVSLQGNGSQAVFRDAIDYTRLLLLIQEGVEKFGHRVHAYALLPDRLRLVVEVEQIPLSRIMQQLGFRYTRWFNDWHAQAGHLFQGRYRALLIDPQSYLLELIRTLHLTPVRAGLVSDPMHYPWCSHRAYCGREKVPWLTTERALSGFAESGIRALMRFHAFVHEGAAHPVVQDFARGGTYDPRVLGDEEFVRDVMKRARQSYQPRIGFERVLRTVLERYRLSEEDLAAAGKNRRCAEARAYLAWLCLETGCLTLTALGDRLGRDVSSLSSAVRRLQLKAAEDPAARERFRSFLKRLRR